MFVVCSPAQSEALHAELVALEVGMFEELGLHFKARGVWWRRSWGCRVWWGCQHGGVCLCACLRARVCMFFLGGGERDRLHSPWC